MKILASYGDNRRQLMSWKLIELDVLTKVVADQSRVFVTKDVSEDERMQQAHPDLINRSHYHSFVGRALSEHHDTLGIVEIKKKTKRGSRWEKQRVK